MQRSALWHVVVRVVGVVLALCLIQPTLMRAQHATPVPRQTALVTLPVAADALPYAPYLFTELVHLSIPAMTDGGWRGEDGAGRPGLRMHYVLHGSYVTRADGPAQVLRARSSAVLDEIPAGTEVQLSAGDTWVIPNTTPFVTENPNDTPTELLLWVVYEIASAADYTYPAPGTAQYHDVDGVYGATLPSGPAIVRLSLVQLPVGARFPVAPGVLQLGVTRTENADGRPITSITTRIGTLGNGTLVNIGTDDASVYVLRVEPNDGARATPDAAA